ncbi:MAG: hypothetical protein M3512_00975 [Bacteroidota bacterium]|nr:hypothetical protein [Bacteroidota bacterium]
MSIHKSSEIRWFFLGKIPPFFKIWFNSAKYVGNQGAREDTYLKFSGSSVGVKFREGNLEIKEITKDLGLYNINEKASGKIEVWQKWSSSDSLKLDILSDLGLEEWVKVKKEGH